MLINIFFHKYGHKIKTQCCVIQYPQPFYIVPAAQRCHNSGVTTLFINVRHHG